MPAPAGMQFIGGSSMSFKYASLALLLLAAVGCNKSGETTKPVSSAVSNARTASSGATILPAYESLPRYIQDVKQEVTQPHTTITLSAVSGKILQRDAHTLARAAAAARHQ
jgi:hypothetical protein